MTDVLYQQCQAMAKAFISASRDSPVTEGKIDELMSVLTALDGVDEEMRERLRRFVEEQVIVTADESTTLEAVEHEPWLATARADYKWEFWERYKRYLTEHSSLPQPVIDRLDETTDEILDHLGNPADEHAWDRRGLVLGQVQSGKTANYSGLIAKAIDVGYRVIIVLAGADNDLRAQTQVRIEEAIIGHNTSGRHLVGARAKKVGVGFFGAPTGITPNPQTTRDPDGDFRAPAAAVMRRIGTDPLVLVIKKNSSVLRNVIKYLTSVTAESGVIPRHPLLLVDDEADHYSVNTAAMGSETDPTVINGLVRRVLDCFEKSAYVGYTATAFANIFVALDDEAEDFGDTLFPRDFMINVHPPSNYMGAQRVFGLNDPMTGVATDPLPVVRRSDDAEDWLPSKHKKTAEPGAFLPDSLERALDSFLLTIAIRRARGQDKAHNSMLVHVTRFNDVQARIRDQIYGRLSRIRTRLRQGDDGETLARLRKLFAEDFEPTTRQMVELKEFGKLGPVEWSDVEPHLRPAVESTEIRTINGLAKEVLDYADRSDGLNVIAIGGNKLSRGLTLEGLSVSYYLRTSRAYDTLLQMGRWFGYRNGYADLCRLYTTSQLLGWYRDITLANAELIAQLDRMADLGATPQEFGLRVRTSPDGLMVSSPNKIRATQKVTLSFADQTREQVAYARNPSKKRQAIEAMDALLTAIRPDEGPGRAGRIIFEGVDGQKVLTFMRAFPANHEARLTRTDLMADYLEDRLLQGELTRWRVVVLSPGSGADRRTWDFGGYTVGLSERASDKRSVGAGTPEPTTDGEQYRVDRILGSEDLKEGLTDEQVRDCEQRAAANAHMSKTDAYRQARTEGLLFLAPLDPVRAQKACQLPSDEGDVAEPYIGLTVVFPPSNEPTAGREYVIGEVYTRMQLGWGDDE